MGMPVRYVVRYARPLCPSAMPVRYAYPPCMSAMPVPTIHAISDLVFHICTVRIPSVSRPYAVRIPSVSVCIPSVSDCTRLYPICIRLYPSVSHLYPSVSRLYPSDLLNFNGWLLLIAERTVRTERTEPTVQIFFFF